MEGVKTESTELDRGCQGGIKLVWARLGDLGLIKLGRADEKLWSFLGFYSLGERTV